MRRRYGHHHVHIHVKPERVEDFKRATLETRGTA